MITKENTFLPHYDQLSKTLRLGSSIEIQLSINSPKRMSRTSSVLTGPNARLSIWVFIGLYS